MSGFRLVLSRTSVAHSPARPVRRRKVLLADRACTSFAKAVVKGCITMPMAKVRRPQFGEGLGIRCKCIGPLPQPWAPAPPPSGAQLPVTSGPCWAHFGLGPTQWLTGARR